jgi:hypothetical protein
VAESGTLSGKNSIRTICQNSNNDRNAKISRPHHEFSLYAAFRKSRKCEDLKMTSVEIACRVLSQNETVQFGIFGLIGKSEYFPPLRFLNEFFMKGHDPCDQDQRMSKWNSFELNSEEYETVRRWWVSDHPRAIKELSDVNCWADWVHEILESI